MIYISCACVLMSQGGSFQLNVDNKFLRISATKNGSEYNGRRIFLRVRA